VIATVTSIYFSGISCYIPRSRKSLIAISGYLLFSTNIFLGSCIAWLLLFVVMIYALCSDVWSFGCRLSRAFRSLQVILFLVWKTLAGIIFQSVRGHDMELQVAWWVLSRLGPRFISGREEWSSMYWLWSVFEGFLQQVAHDMCWGAFSWGVQMFNMIPIYLLWTWWSGVFFE